VCASGYNPPQFILDAAKSALDRVECNQYSPTKGRPRLKKAIAEAYSPFFGRTLDPETEVTITTGANEGMLDLFFDMSRWRFGQDANMMGDGDRKPHRPGRDKRERIMG
jgi:hypothetical protein